MDIEYMDAISFRPLKAYLSENGLKVKYVAERTGQAATRISGLIQGASLPKTDMVGRICAVLRTRASNIVEFRGIETGPYFVDRPLPYMPPLDAAGEMTYRPLWNFLDEYLEGHPGKTANDLFDKIVPPRRKNGIDEKGIKRALEVKYGDGYRPKTRKRTTVGLPAFTRTKLRNDRPLSLRTIYEICRYLGCGIDWVLSYK